MIFINSPSTDSDSELRIVLLGKSGSGKSSTGNTILGKQTFKVDLSSKSVTKESRRRYSKLGDRTVLVIDTPGPFDTHSYNTVKEQVEKAIDLVYPGVHVFLLVIRLGVRFSEEEINTVKWIKDNFGEEIQKHTIVLFTHGNVLKERTIEEHLQEHSVLKEIIGSMADYHVLENENEDDETQVTELLEKINKVVDNNEKKIYTREMYSDVQRKRQQSTYVDYSGVAGVTVGVAAAAARGGVLDITGAAVAATALVIVLTAWAWGKK